MPDEDITPLPCEECGTVTAAGAVDDAGDFYCSACVSRWAESDNQAADINLNAEPYKSAAILGAIEGELGRIGYPRIEQLRKITDHLYDRIEDLENQVDEGKRKLSAERAEHDREMREAGKDLRELERDLAHEHARAEGYY